MSSNNKYRFLSTIAARLTLWYAGIFILSTTIVLLLLYFLTTSLIRNIVDKDLIANKDNFKIILSERGIDAVVQNTIDETRAAGEKKIFFRIIKSDGSMFYSSSMDYWKDIGIDKNAIKIILHSQGTHDAFDTVKVTKHLFEIRILYFWLDQNFIMQIGYSMEHYMKIIEVFRNKIVTIIAILSIASILVGWFMATRALAGVGEVTRIAKEISEGSLDKRVPLKKTGDEIDQLSLTMNQMLDRIQKLITSIKEMSDNIAHDLRSPITRIRGAAEVTLTTNSSLEDYRNTSASTIEECDMLLSMINTMLIISKTEAGVREENFQPLDLSMVSEEACELFKSSAHDKGQTIEPHIEKNIFITGEIRMIQRVIANLIDNAIKYTKEGGRIEFALKKNGENKAILSVKDSGIGIREKDLPHIFERFYRCDPSRNQSGSGLGLSLVQAIVKSHNGIISAESTENQGSTFTIKFPSL